MEKDVARLIELYKVEKKPEPKPAPKPLDVSELISDMSHSSVGTLKSSKKKKLSKNERMKLAIRATLNLVSKPE